MVGGGCRGRIRRDWIFGVVRKSGRVEWQYGGW